MGRGGGRVPGRLWPLESSERRGVRLELGPNCTMCTHSRRTSSCAEMGSVSIHCRLVLRELVCVLAGDDRAEQQQQRVGRVERGGGFVRRHCVCEVLDLFVRETRVVTVCITAVALRLIAILTTKSQFSRGESASHAVIPVWSASSRCRKRSQNISAKRTTR